jgi:hypothetical protein
LIKVLHFYTVLHVAQRSQRLKASNAAAFFQNQLKSTANAGPRVMMRASAAAVASPRRRLIYVSGHISAYFALGN